MRSRASSSVEDPRLAAARAVQGVLGGRSLDRGIEALRCSERDRALAMELAYGVCRWLPRLDAIAGVLLKKPFREKDAIVHALLLVGLYQLLHTRVPEHAAVAETAGAARAVKRPWAVSVINASLRRLQREREAILAQVDATPWQRLAMPEWFYREITRSWPGDSETVLAASNERPPMTLRVNLRRGSRSEYATRLGEVGFESRQVDGVATALTLEEPVGVERLPGFERGDVSLQDAAAQLAANLLPCRPGQRVLDACAAPGGKTGHLLEAYPEIDLTAADVDEGRLQRVHENLSRLGLEARVEAIDLASVSRAWGGDGFDNILLDAPCSGTGVLRRHPDIRVLRRQSDIDSLCERQALILDRVWPLLRTGGKLLYVTCSILPRENELQIAGFLARTASAAAVPMTLPMGRAQQHGWQILTGQAGMDGFYYCLLTKN